MATNKTGVVDLTTSHQSVATGALGTQGVLYGLVLVNTTGSARMVTLELFRAATSTTEEIPEPVGANARTKWPAPIGLMPGDTVRAKADATGVALIWSYLESAGAPPIARPFIIRGAWDTDADYEAIDIVTHDGAVFGAAQDNTGSEPDIAADTADWVKLLDMDSFGFTPTSLTGYTGVQDPADLPISDAAQAALDDKAPLASPALTGNPTAPTQTSGNSTTRLATTAFVQDAITAVVGAAPGALDTLAELAAALNDDADFAAGVLTALAGKQAADATLTALAAVTVAADKLIYATGADGFATTDFGSVARTLVGQTTQAAMRTTGLGMSDDGSALVAAADYAEIRLLLDYAVADVDGLQGYLDAKAPLASPALTGNPTAPTQSPGDNSTKLATTAYADAIAAAKLSLAGGVMTGALTLSGDASSNLHPVTKQQFDAALLGVRRRTTVRVATTANVTIATALNNGDTIDGVTLATDDLVLVRAQTAAEENGVYVVGASPARYAEFDTFNEHAGAMVIVQEGTAFGDAIFYSTANMGGTLNTTAIPWQQIPSSINSYTASGGIALSSLNFTLDINGLTADATPATGDYVPTYDVSASAPKKVLLSKLPISDAVQTALDAKAGYGKVIVATTKTASATLTAADFGKLTPLSHASTAIVLTVPTASSLGLSPGDSAEFIRMGNAECSFAFDSGTAYASEGNKLKLNAAYSSAVLTFLYNSGGSDYYALAGSLKV